MDAILFAFRLSVSMLGIAVAFMVFKAVLSNGTGAIREVIGTIGLALRALCLKARAALLNTIQKETLKTNKNQDPHQVEAPVS